MCSFYCEVDAKTMFPYTIDNTGSLNIAAVLNCHEVDFGCTSFAAWIGAA